LTLTLTQVTLTRTYDTVLPTTTITLPTLAGEGGEYTNVAPVTITVDFSEDVQGFTASDVTVTNGAASNVVEVRTGSVRLSRALRSSWDRCQGEGYEGGCAVDAGEWCG